MVTGITSQVAALVTAIVVLTGGAILRGGPAAADPNQDEHFLALLEQKDIPAIANVPSLIATAHKVCLKLADGMPAEELMDALVNYAYRIDPTARLYAPDRVARTQARFITAAVEAYCPGSESKIASIMADYAPGATKQMNPVAEYTRGAVNSGSDLPGPRLASDSTNMPAARQEPMRNDVTRPPGFMDRGVLGEGRYADDRSGCDAQGVVLASLIGAVLSQGVSPPNPPQIPRPPPPTAQTLIPPRPIAAPPPAQRPPPPQHPPPPEAPPPPPEQPPPPPEQQLPPPAVGPQAGAARGGGGNGGGSGNGGGGPANPAPAMPPGRVRLAP